MSNLRTICRPITYYCCYNLTPRSIIKVSNSLHKRNQRFPKQSSSDVLKIESFLWGPFNNHGQRRRMSVGAAAAANWNDNEKSPYDTLVYDGRGSLAKGETAEARFIKIQAAYELLIDSEERRKYDMENRANPMKASQAWMKWLMKKKKAFDQRGDMAIAAWGRTTTWIK
ncbi:chaperone DnaJ-domain superfamily protein [Tanacetum coccineum]